MAEITVSTELDEFIIEEELRQINFAFEDPQSRKTSTGHVQFEPEHTTAVVGVVQMKVGSHRVVVSIVDKVGERVIYDGRPIE